MNQSGYLQGSGQYPQASGNYGAQPPVYGSGSFGTANPPPIYKVNQSNVPIVNRDHVIPTSYDRASHGQSYTPPPVSTNVQYQNVINPVPVRTSNVPTQPTRFDTDLQYPQKKGAFSPSCCCWSLLGIFGLLGLVLGILFGVGVLGRSGADIKNLANVANQINRPTIDVNSIPNPIANIQVPKITPNLHSQASPAGHYLKRVESSME